MRELRSTCPECGANIYTGYRCYCCGWELKLFKDGGTIKMNAFMICGVCNGVKWTQIPDWDGNGSDNTANAVPMKGCTCPPKPEPKTELGITVLCPSCKGLVTVTIKGLPAEDIYSTFFDEGEKE